MIHQQLVKQQKQCCSMLGNRGKHLFYPQRNRISSSMKKSFLDQVINFLLDSVFVSSIHPPTRALFFFLFSLLALPLRHPMEKHRRGQ